jgi:hypothetical protein
MLTFRSRSGQDWVVCRNESKTWVDAGLVGDVEKMLARW